MPFLKKFLLLCGVLLLFLGGSGTQSNSLLMQGIGFAGFLIGAIVLYIFGRMMWKGLGCLPSFLSLVAIALFMMYALGMFNNGIGGVGESVIRFIGYHPKTEADQDSAVQGGSVMPDMRSAPDFQEDFPQPEQNKPEYESAESLNFEENIASPVLFGASEAEKTAEKQQEPASMVDKFAAKLGYDKRTQEEPRKQFDPKDYPVVYGSVRVITADTLEMYGKYFQLFGIDAPEANQTCSNRQGNAYNCGRDAAMWLKNWIGDNELECRVIQQDTKGNMVGTCSYGPYDLGAALVNAGWAVAYVKYTDIYYPYELQAQQNRRGLWQGSFYKPWDWRKIQARKPKIKVIQPQKRKSGLFG